MDMFAFNLTALASEGDVVSPATVGWVIIAFAWSVIGALWMASSFLTHSHFRHSNSSPIRARRPSGVVTHAREVRGGS